MDSNKARVAVALLEDVVNDRQGATDALAAWPEGTQEDPHLALAWHDVSHFAVDADIRERDPKYAEYQRDLLTKRIRAIRESYKFAGAPVLGPEP
jgi:hypothetical protein